MTRSTTVWVATLALASMSGSGPVGTVAEAMPAPQPKQTQGKPRYYFPRHVKRQINTDAANATAPATPSSSSTPVSSSSS
ncbi:hypothetical protein C7974DRAFT_288757, partial [Boeremia exigua]|uniref:uncharacterized protein n=1 Tax=Boeremia exigua TaxID=749465 RepID=UPI001E8E3FCA